MKIYKMVEALDDFQEKYGDVHIICASQKVTVITNESAFTVLVLDIKNENNERMVIELEVDMSKEKREDF